MNYNFQIKRNKFFQPRKEELNIRTFGKQRKESWIQPSQNRHALFFVRKKEIEKKKINKNKNEKSYNNLPDSFFGSASLGIKLFKDFDSNLDRKFHTPNTNELNDRNFLPDFASTPVEFLPNGKKSTRNGKQKVKNVNMLSRKRVHDEQDFSFSNEIFERKENKTSNKKIGEEDCWNFSFSTKELPGQENKKLKSKNDNMLSSKPLHFEDDFLNFTFSTETEALQCGKEIKTSNGKNGKPKIEYDTMLSRKTVHAEQDFSDFSFSTKTFKSKELKTPNCKIGKDDWLNFSSLTKEFKPGQETKKLKSKNDNMLSSKPIHFEDDFLNFTFSTGNTLSKKRDRVKKDFSFPEIFEHKENETSNSKIGKDDWLNFSFTADPRSKNQTSNSKSNKNLFSAPIKTGGNSLDFTFLTEDGLNETNESNFKLDFNILEESKTPEEMLSEIGDIEEFINKICSDNRKQNVRDESCIQSSPLNRIIDSNDFEFLQSDDNTERTKVDKKNFNIFFEDNQKLKKEGKSWDKKQKPNSPSSDFTFSGMCAVNESSKNDKNRNIFKNQAKPQKSRNNEPKNLSKNIKRNTYVQKFFSQPSENSEFSNSIFSLERIRLPLSPKKKRTPLKTKLVEKWLAQHNRYETKKYNTQKSSVKTLREHQKFLTQFNNKEMPKFVHKTPKTKIFEYRPRINLRDYPNNVSFDSDDTTPLIGNETKRFFKEIKHDLTHSPFFRYSPRKIF